MKKYFTILIIAFITSQAFAADDLFDTMDRNGDGSISKQEFIDAARRSFDQADKNRDGILTQDELAHMNKKDRNRLTKEADANRDGIISKEEFEQAVEKRFFLWDKNKDGRIDKKEWKMFQPKRNSSGWVLFTF